MRKYIKGEVVLEFIEKNGYSKTAFARKCGISYSVLKKILEGRGDFYGFSIINVALEMGVKVEDLIIYKNK